MTVLLAIIENLWNCFNDLYCYFIALWTLSTKLGLCQEPLQFATGFFCYFVKNLYLIHLEHFNN